MLTLSPSGLLDKRKINTSELSSLDPTYVSRYLLLAGILESYRHHHGGKKLKVLDVGGSGSMMEAFADVDLTIIDVLPNTENRDNYIQGSALTTPFADSAFDAVISCDVLEHIDANDRATFLKESARVSKDLLVVAAPFNLPGVRKAEISANDYYKKMTGRDHRWLLEHLLDELPNLKKTEMIMENQGLEVDHFSNTALNNWQLVTRVGFLLSEQSVDSEFATSLRQLNVHYMENIMQNDFSNTGYRTFVVGSKRHEIDIKHEADVYDKKLVDTFTLLTDAMLPLL